MVLNQRVRRLLFASILSILTYHTAMPVLSCPPAAFDIPAFDAPASAVLTAFPGNSAPPPDEVESAFRTENAAFEVRLERLEENLDGIGAQLEAINDAIRRRGQQIASRFPRQSYRPSVPGTPFYAADPPNSRPWPDPVLPVPSSPRARFMDEDLVVRSYQLSPGKLEALSKLMARDDVPIRVRPLEDRIEVHATERNQAIFKGFVDMIHARKQARTYRVSSGKAGALAELMIRSDVPILVEPGNGTIKVHGTPLEQSVFKAFLSMIDPQHDPRDAAGAGTERGDGVEPPPEPE